MSLNRRQFLQAAAGASLLGLAGCSDVPAKIAQLGLTMPAPNVAGPFGAPVEAGKDLIAHVISRVSFGAAPGDYDHVREIGIDAYIDEQLSPDTIDDSFCERRIRRLQTIHQPVGELFEYREKLLLNDLTQATLLRATYSKRQLFEVMAGFWTDHFNIDSSKGDCAWLKTADDREVIRKHALGNFKDLVRASALSPAMLWYLDGRENKVASENDSANENYARELLELHTLGVHGGYTQDDVMEVARCVSGWHVRSDEWFGKGTVEFKPEFHDDGEKHVLGHRIPAGQGKGDLDSVIDIVTKHPSTAAYIALKLCKRFTSDEPFQATIDLVAQAFMKSDGDIPSTLHALFATDEFRNVRDTKTKRPFRFMVSALRASGADTDAGPQVTEYLDRMGQSPFQYPTPDGYPDEPEPWLGTLVWRWQFAVALGRGQFGGTTAPWKQMINAYGNDEAFAAHILGRRPMADEMTAYHASDLGPAMILASPAFQRY